jgi:hypothetical protein
MPSSNGHGPKRAILYARVSTDEQARSGYSLAQQLEALREYAACEGYEVLEEITDPGQSGASLERPGMDRDRDVVTAGGVSVVLAQDRAALRASPPITTSSGESSRSTARRYAPSTIGETTRRKASLRTAYSTNSPSSRERRPPRGRAGGSSARRAKASSSRATRPGTASVLTTAAAATWWTTALWPSCGTSSRR